jgi:cell division initiation protein
MKKFNKEFNGYKKQEVNAFLNDVIVETEKMLRKVNLQQQEILELKKEIIRYKEIEKSLTLALDSAEKAGENIRMLAREESKAIIDDAKRNASRIINDALIRNEKLELKREQTERNLRVFKNRLRAIVEQQLEVVEEIETLEIEE